jgi:RHS repeat-associated protein
MNPAGQVLQETLGNGVLVNHAFDGVTAQVQNIQAGVGGGAVLQNNTYQFDAVGNLIQRQYNNTPGTTENVFPDALYRLDHTVGDSSTAMSYDAMGRIAAWGAGGQLSNVTDYTTPQSGCTYYADHAQPHAVRSSTNAGSSFSPNAFCYDANGNMLSQTNPRGTTSVVWTGFNQPSAITGALGSSQFYYDANHQRYMQQAIYSGAVENTIYVGGLVEKMSNSSGTAYRHYIPAGNNTVIYTRTSSGTNSTYYMTQDHLGSTAVITDQTGNPVIQEQFAALGWPESSTSVAGTVSRHEFAGQEDLDNVFMVNMNGRVYLPSGGFFLSPDPFIPDPSDTQSFNRYAYVNNNPLSLIDPSGYDGEPPSNGQDPLDEIQVEGLRMGAGDNTSAFFASSARTSFGEVFFPGPIPQATIFGGGRSFGQPPLAGVLTTPPLFFEDAAPIIAEDIVGDEARGQARAGKYAKDHPMTIPNLIMANFLGFGVVNAITRASVQAPAAIVARIAQSHADSGIAELSKYMSRAELAQVLSGGRTSSAIMGQAVHRATALTLDSLYPGEYQYFSRAAFDFVYTPTGEVLELTTPGQMASHLDRGADLVFYILHH